MMMSESAQVCAHVRVDKLGSSNIRITQNTRLERRKGKALSEDLPKGVRPHHIRPECRLRRKGCFHLRRQDSRLFPPQA
jgi:hypothetical protein